MDILRLSAVSLSKEQEEGVRFSKNVYLLNDNVKDLLADHEYKLRFETSGDKSDGEVYVVATIFTKEELLESELPPETFSNDALGEYLDGIFIYNGLNFPEERKAATRYLESLNLKKERKLYLRNTEVEKVENFIKDLRIEEKTQEMMCMSDCLESSENNVSKFIFTGKDFIAESVLYTYQSYMSRTVICCSTQSGCRVGCSFCGTGKNFIRDLTWLEIVAQVKAVLREKDIEDVDEVSFKFQIMFMSMGEPMHNWKEVKKAIRELHRIYPNAELLMSTVGIDDNGVLRELAELSKEINKIGLQFSIHKSTDEARDKLIPYDGKLSLKRIRDYGLFWWKKTGRNPYLNYCIDGTNNTTEDFDRLETLFSPIVFNLTFNVVCSSNEDNKKAGFKDMESIEDFEKLFKEKHYNTRVFNPEGQDDIGGGCGQLWHVQNWMKTYKGGK